MAFRKNPLKVGEKFKVKVERLTRRGDGFVKINGVAVFVKNVEIGWEGEVVIEKVGPTYAIAKPI